MHMESSSGVSQILVRCEKEIRERAVSALSKADYSLSRSLMDLAQELSALRDRYTGDVVTSVEVKPLPVRRAKAVAAVKSKAAYPHFVREDESIVKVGWSKKEKAEYEHRASLDSVRAFVRHLAAAAIPGRIWTVESILPVPSLSGDSELPEYQIYLVLAWLRSVSLIDKHGRNGYSVRPPGINETVLEKALTSVRSAAGTGGAS